MSLVVDTEAANTEDVSKMKGKMQRFDKLKFRTDALIQAALAELVLRLLFGSRNVTFPLEALLRLY